MSQKLVSQALGRQLGTVSLAFTTQAPRTFATTAAIQRSAQEAVQDTLKRADRAISDKIVDGIDVGSTMTQKLKEGVEEIKAGKATGQAERIRDEMARKASETASSAEGTASKAAGQASKITRETKGKAKEMAGEAKGKAKEMAGEAKGKAEEVKGKVGV